NPEVIGAARPNTLLLVRKEESESIVTSLNAAELEDLSLVLTEVGVRLSDVFGADAILWVEGQTEEQSFPLIVERILHRQLEGVKILGVMQTGDFDKRYADRVIHIYNRLSTAGALVPPAVGYIFDRELRSARGRRTPTEAKLTALNRGSACAK